MNCGIVIPYYATEEKHVTLLANCLRSLEKHKEIYERVVIIDDASPIRVPKKLLDKPYVTYWRKQYNRGYSDTVNAALTMFFERKYDWVLTLNQDVEITRPFTPFIREIHNGDMADVVGGALLYPTGHVQSAGFEVVPGTPLVKENAKFTPYVTQLSEAHTARYVMGVTGAMQFIKKTCTPYSANYELGYEDVEFCIRQWSEGRRVLYAPAIEAVHVESAVRGRLPSPRELRSVEQWESDVQTFDIEKIRADVAKANEIFVNPPPPGQSLPSTKKLKPLHPLVFRGL